MNEESTKIQNRSFSNSNFSICSFFQPFYHVWSSNMTPHVNHFFLILKPYFVTFLEMYTLYMITQILNEKKLFLVIAPEIEKKNSDPLRILRVNPTANKEDSREDTEEEMAVRTLAKGRGRERSSPKYPHIYSDDETQKQSQGSAGEPNKEDREPENKSKLDSEDSEYKNRSGTSSSSSYSSNDETEVSNLSAEKYYTQTKPENPSHQWSIGFYDNLSRPAISDKKRAIRHQHAGQMRTLFKHLDPKGKDITCLATDKGNAVWKRWVKPTLSGGSKKAATVISYLTSLGKF